MKRRDYPPYDTILSIRDRIPDTYAHLQFSRMSTFAATHPSY